MKDFKRILIANRGEIACRIIRTSKLMGLTSIVVFSEADRDTLAVELADESYYLGSADAQQSYLNADKIIALALEVKAQAIHPGYGFLSEDSQFARKVMAANLVWIGPHPDSMEAVSDKAQAKKLARTQSVPMSPGIEETDDVNLLKKAAAEIGYPVLLKASAGGGGRGIRKVLSESDLKEQFAQAQSEALQAFGNGNLLLEKYIADAHHIEVQIFGDTQGNIIHLGERDCSAQRRHQKVIEESPSPILTSALREEICNAAIKIGQAAHYINAGTVEFLVTPDKKFYFLEVNTRLQVEHPVTEMITGLDLVEWQIRIARGEKLPLKQNEIQFHGHSIQARLYAEDPYQQFRPQTGRIEGFYFPENIRVDHFLTGRSSITPFYDSMIAKIIVHATDRNMAREFLVKALDQTVIAGLTTNRLYLRQILESDFFKEGKTLTQSLEREKFEAPKQSTQAKVFSKAAAAFVAYPTQDPFFGWSNNPHHQASTFLRINDASHLVSLSPEEFIELAIHNVTKVASDKAVDFIYQGEQIHALNLLKANLENDVMTNSDTIVSPMQGSLKEVRVKSGEKITKGQILGIVEAMKMQFELLAPRDGEIEDVLLSSGAQVKNKQVIIKLIAL